MNTNQHFQNPRKALVTVFEDLETARQAVEVLHEAGFSTKKIELVTRNVHLEAPEIQTPKVHETTTSSLIDQSAKWGGIGAATGVIAAVLTPFPGVALGMILIGGVTGAIVGGMAGLEHAVDDDSVNLPEVDEYEAMVADGYSLVVVLGSHEEAMRAESVIKEMHYVHSHIHPVHGHEFHEHPSH